MTTRDDRYWTVDLPGMSAEKADDLLRSAARIGLTGTAVDPRRWLTRHLDVDTVDALLRKLSDSPAEPGDEVILTALVDDIREWRGRAQTE